MGGCISITSSSKPNKPSTFVKAHGYPRAETQQPIRTERKNNRKEADALRANLEAAGRKNTEKTTKSWQMGEHITVVTTSSEIDSEMLGFLMRGA